MGKGGEGEGGGGKDSDIQIVDRGLVWQTSCPVTRGESQALSHALFFSLSHYSFRKKFDFTTTVPILFSHLLAW